MVGQVTAPTQDIRISPPPKPPLIGEREIKAILYMGLRGEIALPIEERKVDILA